MPSQQESPTRRTPASNSAWRTWPIFAITFLVTMTFWWFGLSGMNYRKGDSDLSAFTTAGWFYLGFPMTLGMSIGAGICAAKLARRHMLYGTLIPASLLCLTLLYVCLGLPRNRLAGVIGNNAASIATLEELREHDSFNEGKTTIGILSGPMELLEEIVAFRELEKMPERHLHILRSCFPGSPLPETAEAWCDEESIFYQDPKDKRIYFYKHREREFE